ncbi:Aste57867_161 [Aphanomyces stellatus]|uniref:Aste57867_161 protein n=1 Tax=Aphanomyces stellatus TaxID=120398 RepID=A0A485K619_9STRA|nr:hypothetical protein As57867_000161 [Aphanomyces stellatus]VFT77387.1 Aste57867_161 [Aphanomyces stellatus]
MWSALFGSDDDSNRDPEVNESQEVKIYAAGDEPDAMTMLLGRLTHLLERLGEAEYSKKKWEEQARKLESVNQQLKYQLDYSTDSQLRERIDDLTAMNDALKEVKMTLEKDVEAKEHAANDHKNNISRLEEAMSIISHEKEELASSIEALKKSTDQELERLSNNLERQSQEVARLTSECEAEVQKREIESHNFHSIEQQHKARAAVLEQKLAQSVEVERSLDLFKAEVQRLEDVGAQNQNELVAQKQLEFDMRQEIVRMQNEGQRCAEMSNAERVKLFETEHRLKQVEEQLQKREAFDNQDKWKEEALRTLTQQVKNVQAELSEALELNLRLSGQNSWLEEQSQVHEYMKKQLEGTNESLEAHLEHERTIVQQQTVELESLKSSLHGHELSAETSALKIDQMRREIDELQRHDALLTSKIHVIENQWSQKYNNLSAEILKANSLVTEQHREIALLSESNVSYQNQIESLKEVIAKNEKEVMSTEDKEIIGLHATLVQECETLRIEVEKAYAKNQIWQNSYAALKEDMDALDKKHDIASQQVVTLEADKSGMLAHHQAKLLELEYIVESKSSELERAQNQIESTQADLRAWEETSQDYLSQIKLLEQGHEALKLEKSELLESNKNSSNIEEQFRRLEHEHVALKTSFETLTSQHASEKAFFSQQLLDTRNELDSLHQQVKNSQEFAQECEDTALEWEQKYDELYAEMTIVSGKLSHLEASSIEEKEALIQKLEALKSNNEDVHNSLNGNLDELRNNLQSKEQEINKLQSENEGLFQNINNLQIEKQKFDNDRLEVVSEIHRLKEILSHEESVNSAQLNDLHLKLRESVSESAHLRTTLADCESRAKNLENASQIDKDVAKQLQVENQELMANLESGKRAFEVLKESHEQYRGEVSSLQAELGNKELLLHELEAQMLKKGHDFELEKNTLLGELESSKKMVENVHASAEMSTQNLEDHIRELQEQVHSHNNKFESETEELLEEIASLNAQLSELQVQNNVLSARAHRLARDLSQYVKLPADDMALVLNPNTPNLWELLHNGMEQLKSDLEVASTYAANLDQMDTMDNLQDGNFSFSSSADHSQEIVFIDHQNSGLSY